MKLALAHVRALAYAASAEVPEGMEAEQMRRKEGLRPIAKAKVLVAGGAM